MMSEMFPEGSGPPEGFEPRLDDTAVPPELAALFARMGVPPSAEVTERTIRDTARIHGLWFAAWKDSGFSEDQAFELARILVCRALGGD